MNDVTFERFVQEDPNVLAIVDTHGERWTRGEVAAFAHRLARVLGEAGVGVGDAIAILAPNCGEYLAACLAGIEAGLYVVPVNWHLADAELAGLLEDCNARAVIAHGRLGAQRLTALAAVAPRGALLLCIGAAPGYRALAEVATAQSSDPLPPAVWGRIMPFTSATTGRPKAVKLPLDNARTALERMVRWHVSLGIAPADANVHLCASMLYHSAPLLRALLALHMGHVLVLVERWDAEQLLCAIEQHDVTTTFMVPTMFVRLLQLPAEVRDRYRIQSLRLVIHGGAPCPPEVKHAMLEWWGPIIWESYGAAEGQGAIASPAEWLARPGTVGRAIPGARLRILNEAGQEQPPHAVGLVYMLPYTGDRFEYAGDSARTRAGYRGDLITVGDLGFLDDDGYLFLCGRQSELIISSGMNIYPAEIEQVLVQHPAVADCAVVAAAHPLFGQVPHATVQLQPSAQPSRALSAELLAFLAARLSPMKLPKRIGYVHRLPRDPAGKLFKRLLPPATGGDPDDAGRAAP